MEVAVSCRGEGLFLVLVLGEGASPCFGMEDIWKMMVSPDCTPMLDIDLSLSEMSRGLGGKPVVKLVLNQSPENTTLNSPESNLIAASC